MQSAPTVHLVDASPYIFRAYFSLPATLTDPAGRQVNAVYGFLGFLNRLLGEERPTHVAVAFDRSLTTSFRNQIYPAYKSGRELPPPALERQQQLCMDAARAVGLVAVDDPAYEADDLIATLHARVAARGARVVIVTSDKDLGQLVDARTELYDLGKGARIDAAALEARLGLPPARVPDFQGLAGDPVDGIPGVRGVGPKTACALLAAFGTLDGVYARLDEVAELPMRGARTLAARLAEGREIAFLSRELARLSTAAPIPPEIDLEALAWPGADRARVAAFLLPLGFGARVLARVLERP